MFDELKAASLLPPNATVPEHPLAGLQRLADKLDDPISKMWDAWQVPVEALPMLAWAVRVPLWDEDWPETKKRSIIAEAPELNAAKGRVYAIKRYVEIAGGRVVDVRLPPEGIYPGAGQSAEEYEAWISRFAEIRIYDRPGGDVILWDFLGETFIDEGGGFLGEYAPKPSHRAVVIDGGIETELELVELRVNRADGTTHIVEKLFGPAFAQGGFYSDDSYFTDHLDTAQDTLFLQIDGGVMRGRDGLTVV